MRFSPPAPYPYPQQHHYPVVVTQPVQMMPANYGMPAYLSTPETRQVDESFWSPLAREVFRSVGKAFGHSIATFFDHTAFSRKPDE